MRNQYMAKVLVHNKVVTQDQMVYAGTRMICLSFENGNEEYRSLVTKRRQYEDLMAELFALYTDDTITAPEAGFVSGIDGFGVVCFAQHYEVAIWPSSESLE